MLFVLFVSKISSCSTVSCDCGKKLSTATLPKDAGGCIFLQSS